MKFIDEAIIEVKAGDGGNGCISFRREKFVPRGGPDGGNGGDGGNVYIEARAGLTTLMDVQYRKRFQAGDGMHGKGKDMYGKGGEDVVIPVPVGTEIFEVTANKEIADLTKPGEKFLIAKGGRGGRGNMHFASSTRQAPKVAQEGKQGEEKKIRLELKLLADVGLIGFPNAGKSTLISAISNAKPKVADYPFTTKVPHLGVVKVYEEESFVVADIPGLIEGAHEGAGMGIQFLKHIERTRILLHLIDVVDPSRTDPIKMYAALRTELKAYHKALLDKPEVIVLTKMDIPEAEARSRDTVAHFTHLGKEVFLISAVRREGLQKLIRRVLELLKK